MKRLLLWSVGFVVLGLLVWAFNVFYERYDKEIKIGYSTEAKRNPFLAAQLFLQKNGVSVVEETDVLDFSKIGFNETVFLSNVDDMILTESQIVEALEWIDQGGFLIVGVGDEITGSASLLERFDIDPIEYEVSTNIESLFGDGSESASQRLRKLNEEIDKEEESGESSEETLSFNDLLDQDFDSQEQQYKVHLSDGFGELTLQVLDNIVLNHPLAGDIVTDDGSSQSNDDWYGDYEDNYTFDAIIRDEKGPRLLQFGYGKGTFTALSSSIVWENDNIGEADHAFFLAYFVPDDASVRFFYNIVSPSLWSLLKDNFSELLIAAFILLFIWLWQISLRTQGIRHEVTSQRRAFSENLRSSAEFLVSKEQYSLLLKSIQADIDTQMRLLKPGYMDMSLLQQTSLLSVTAELPKETIQSWFDALNSIDNQEHMIAAIKIGNLIRTKL